MFGFLMVQRDRSFQCAKYCLELLTRLFTLFLFFQTGLNLSDWAMRVPFDFIKNVGEAKPFHMCPQGQSKGHWATEFCWCLNVNGFFNAASDLLLFGGDFGFCLLLLGVFFFKVKTEDYQDYVTAWKKKKGSGGFDWVAWRGGGRIPSRFLFLCRALTLGSLVCISLLH